MNVRDIANLYGVDYHVEDAKVLLQNSPIRLHNDRIEVDINNEWMHLCRTDLKDDVCTWRPDEIPKDLEQVRQLYLNNIKYGARIRQYGNSVVFAIIDSYSDG